MKFIFIALVASFPLFAQDFTFDKESGQAVPKHIAQVKIAKGKVFKLTNGTQKEIKVGDRLYKSDTLITNSASIAQILIVDDTIMTLGANSELNFAEFKFVDKTKRQAVYSFIRGQIRGLIKNKAQEGDIVIQTKLATMGIRGTELFVNHQTINNLEVSEFALISGKVVVNDDKKAPHELSKKDRIIIVQDSLSQESAHEKNALSEEELKSLNEENSLMNLFNPGSLEKSSSLYALFNKAAAATPEAGVNQGTTSEPEKKDWKNNLRKLNEKLKDYQKK
jgi:Ni2+-binding GTPase involved in maturation of urease and hydrogenase